MAVRPAAGGRLDRAGLASILRRFRVARVDAAGTDGAVLLFTLVVSLATGAIRRPPGAPSASPERRLRQRAAPPASPPTACGRFVLETALALVLLAGAGTLLKTFVTLRTTHPGFEPSHVLALGHFHRSPASPSATTAPGSSTTRFDGFMLPGVRSARSSPTFRSAAALTPSFHRGPPGSVAGSRVQRRLQYRVGHYFR
jgi:hypothetical protein